MMMETPPSKRPRYDNEAPAGVGGNGRPAPLVAMLLDVEEAQGGRIHLFGLLPGQGSSQTQTLLVRVEDFQGYWFIPSPIPTGDDPSMLHARHAPWPPDKLDRLKSLLNMRLPPDCRVVDVSEISARPIMYYRPHCPDGCPHLRLTVPVGSSVRKAAERVHEITKSGQLAGHGFEFPIRQDYESDVKPLTRFLCDTSLSGAAWVFVPPQELGMPDGGYRVVPQGERVSQCDVEVITPWRSLQSLTPDATQLADPGWAPPVLRQLQLQLQGEASSGAVAGGPPRTPVKQQRPQVHAPHTPGNDVITSSSGAAHSAAAGGHAPGHQDMQALREVLPLLLSATKGAVLPLKVCTVDVQLAPRDLRSRQPRPESDPLVAIACELRVLSGSGGDNAQPLASPNQGHGEAPTPGAVTAQGRASATKGAAQGGGERGAAGGRKRGGGAGVLSRQGSGRLKGSQGSQARRSGSGDVEDVIEISESEEESDLDQDDDDEYDDDDEEGGEVVLSVGVGTTAQQKQRSRAGKAMPGEGSDAAHATEKVVFILAGPASGAAGGGEAGGGTGGGGAGGIHASSAGGQGGRGAAAGRGAGRGGGRGRGAAGGRGGSSAAGGQSSAAGGAGKGSKSESGTLAGGSGTTGGTGAGWRPAAAPLDVSGPPVATLEVEGAQVVLCASEEELITRWQVWMAERNPDALATFQVRDTIGALIERAQALRVPMPTITASTTSQQGRAGTATTGVMSPGTPGQHRTAGGAGMGGGVSSSQAHVSGGAPGALYLSRLLPRYAAPLATKSVVQYTVAWVKSQSRMSGNSNQETFKLLNIGGRLLFDVLRQVLTHKSLATFTLPDCVGTILGQTIEVLHPQQVGQLWEQVCKRDEHKGRSPAPEAPISAAAHLASSPDAAAARLARYGLRRIRAVRDLMSALATVPEAVEMARVTGISMTDVMYKAQMVRTWSLLLRNARRHNFLVGGKQEVGQLIESPYLMHPIENKTAGLYRAPVATLDFASLYPSIYRAHNLCYTTLVVPEDVGSVGRESVVFTPSGHAFVRPEKRKGILPTILAALVTARAATREALKALPPAKSSSEAAAAAAVLDSRQKALKLAANALYGFTGAGASPLQCVPLADSCLAYGAQSCRTAIAEVPKLLAEGVFGEAGRGARVIYGQTDSLFLHFPHASAAEAVKLGKLAAKLISQRCFPPPIELKYERVCHPFLLLHVNRYAGRSFETEDQAASGASQGLVVKGVRSMWRQSAPYVQRTLQGVLQRVIMEDSVERAVTFAEEEIHRLLSGRVELWELVMTGGLWRITGEQVARAAAAAREGGAEPGAANGKGAGAAGGGGANAAGGGGDEEVRGPHANLAVKLQARDPGRTFLLGERLQYILLQGVRLQDEAAEDPLLAAEQGLPPDLSLYFRNKLMVPLLEILEKCLSKDQLQALQSGPHTLTRVEQLPASAVAAGAEGGAMAAAAAGVGAAAGSASSSAATVSVKDKKGGGKQAGMTSFFQQRPKCLRCRQVLPSTPQGQSQPPGQQALPPGLCPSCLSEPWAWQETWAGIQQEAGTAQKLLSAAAAQCMRCHSGGVVGKIACSNAECNVLYDRLGAARRLALAGVRLGRLHVCAPIQDQDDAW